MTTENKTRRNIKSAFGAGFVGSALIVSAAPAWAQDQDGDKAPNIVVIAARQNHNNTTGTKTDAPLIETPQAVSVVTSDQLDTIKTSTLSDALNYIPGLLTQPSSNARYADQVTIRGFLADPAYGNFLLDGLKLQSNLYDGGVEPYGLERVEVLRGASSVLYGTAAPGGIINSISKRGPTKPVLDANLEYGSFDRKQVSADVGGPIGDGTVSLRLTGLYRDANTSVNYVQDNKRFIAPALTLRLGTKTEISFLGTYQVIDTKFSAPLPLVGTLVTPANGVKISRSEFTGEPSFDRFSGSSGTGGVQFQHSFNDSVKAHIGARYFQALSHMDYLVLGTSVSGNSLTRTPSPRTNNSKGATIDSNLDWKFGSDNFKNSVLVGLDYYHHEYGYHRYAGTTALWNYVNPVYGQTNLTLSATDIGSGDKGDQTGIYVQDQIKLFQKLVVLIGGRHDWATDRTQIYSTNAYSWKTDQATTGRAGLVYLLGGGWAPYASFSQSFQPQTGVDRNNVAFQPTRGVQYEGGLRYAPDHSSTTLSAAVYQLSQTNVLTPDPVNTTYSIQTGEVRSRGVELEAKTVVNKVWNIIASYTYTDSIATKTNVAAQLNQQVAAVPKNTASFWSDYTFTKLGLPGLRLGGAVRYIGKTNLPGLSFDVPDYTLVDLYGSYNFSRFRLALNVKNLANHTYYYCNTTTQCRYGDPRTIVGTLSYRL